MTGVVAPLLIRLRPVAGAVLLMLIVAAPEAGPVPWRSRMLSRNCPVMSSVLVLASASARTVALAPTKVRRVSAALTGVTSQSLPADQRSAAVLVGVKVKVAACAVVEIAAAAAAAAAAAV